MKLNAITMRSKIYNNARKVQQLRIFKNFKQSSQQCSQAFKNVSNKVLGYNVQDTIFYQQCK